jgi:hypothetical protein
MPLKFRAELDRRLRLRLGSGLKAPDPANNPATARPYRLIREVEKPHIKGYLTSISSMASWLGPSIITARTSPIL